MAAERFESRHIGPRGNDVDVMLKSVGAESIDQLIDETVPTDIRLSEELAVSRALTEYEFSKHISALAAMNKPFKSYIGMGYYGTITPAPIQRNVLENPGWYTAYTPYQAEIAQGRLEALINFQSMIVDLTGLPIANASLLDESTAISEAMIMFFNNMPRSKKKAGANKFFVSDEMFPQTIAVLEGRAEPLGIEIVKGDFKTVDIDDAFFGATIQYPTLKGEVHEYAAWAEELNGKEVRLAVAADLLSLTMLQAPGKWGADVVAGSSQRFGVPMGYGGPHAAFFATTDEFKRNIPGRIIGASQDKDGNPGYRMALQTREQHIRREKATSNICTAQALLAVMASFYAVYHGPQGLRSIAETIHKNTSDLADTAEKMGLKRVNQTHFDTITFEATKEQTVAVKLAAEAAGINFRYEEGSFGITLDETVTEEELQEIITVLNKGLRNTIERIDAVGTRIPASLMREVDYMSHPVFNMYRSESQLMRYIKKLENRDMSLTHSMISLGSCTMKLNAASELYPITNPSFANVHPFVPVEQVGGYQAMLEKLGLDLSVITGFDAMSFQPNSGAQGEYAGLMVIRAYHQSRGDSHRNVCLIPSSAHGTNPASAVMAGMKVVVTKADEHGNIDVEDLRMNAEKYSDELAALMVTYPSTHGVFEASIREIMDIIHDNGGQVYMDGANMNAQVGLTSPGFIGADVCHLNLHKTFAIPHGGGGPGMGPIGVAKHLTPFLPNHPVIASSGEQGIKPVSGAQYGSALILLISYAYIRMLGSKGLTNSTKMAILNANYMKSKLESAYPILYQGANNRVAHEMIVDCRSFKKEAGIEVEDIAKRLIDYGFHAPTVSFPVAGTLMIEPTESESKDELDRFCDALLSIRGEIEEIIEGRADTLENVLKNAPHTAGMVTSDEWNKPYSRKQAAYPLPYLRDAKFWPHVRRIDNAFGDRNLNCTCLPVEAYLEEA